MENKAQPVPAPPAGGTPESAVETMNTDLERLAEAKMRLERGEISAAEFRAIRVPQGVYEERGEQTFMLRVRLPAGLLLPRQARTLARVARVYGGGTLHVTTRQDIQVHKVPLDGVYPALVELAGSGLSTKGGGGNTVRNVTACAYAGVCSRELFDVTPEVERLTAALLPDPLSYRLPRKYKIAVSGCPEDCAGAAVNDLGFIARRQEGRPGFAVYVGGGMGAHSRVADLLDEFVPVEEAPRVAEAVKRVFDKHGNRRNRARARLRFLVEQLGVESFRALYQRELDGLVHWSARPARRDPRPAVAPLPAEGAGEGTTAGPAAGTPQTAEEGAPVGPAERYKLWLRRNVRPQKQSGCFLVHIPLPLGDVSAAALHGLAAVAEEYGEGYIRATQTQNLVLRFLRQEDLPALHARLDSLGLAEAPPPIVRNLVSCTGASTCKLGICLSRGLTAAVLAEFQEQELDLESWGDLRIHVSGCPNSCGRHPVADIGLFGAARRHEGRLVPHYVVQVGGGTGEGRARLAEGQEAVPARHVPALLAAFLRNFQGSTAFPDFQAFLAGEGRARLSQLCASLKVVPPISTDPRPYYDWGAAEPFSLAGRGPGECGAGVFDLIEIDLATAAEALETGALLRATSHTCRALLVTQGREARSETEALELFAHLFLETGLVPHTFEPLLARARAAAAASEPETAFATGAERDRRTADVAALLAAVRTLYDSMDDSLRFTRVPGAGAEVSDAVEVSAAAEVPGAGATAPARVSAPVARGAAPAATAAGRPVPDREEDLRGVVCPLNYVRTKRILDGLAPGQVLAVLLDGPGVRNVPDSTSKDGHEVLSIEPEAEHWRLLIRRR